MGGANKCSVQSDVLLQWDHKQDQLGETHGGIVSSRLRRQDKHRLWRQIQIWSAHCFGSECVKSKAKDIEVGTDTDIEHDVETAVSNNADEEEDSHGAEDTTTAR